MNNQLKGLSRHGVTKKNDSLRLVNNLTERTHKH